MKNLTYIFTSLSVLFLLISCDQGIDGITEVDPGADVSSPVVTIKAPLDGAKFKVNDPVISIDIEFEVTDDIEVGSISVFMDGSEIAKISDFIDYRRVLENMTANNISTGVHELKVTATDLDGKSTTATVSFEKEPPYVPLFSNEVLYMAFDEDFTELISVKPATKVGSPGFAGEAVVGSNAYSGNTDSYLTIPTAGLQLGSEFSASFWYKVNSAPDRAGILVIGPPDAVNPDKQNNRSSGFRLFRENAGGKQRIKLNVGTGAGDTWVDGGSAADIDPNSDEWVNIAFTISATTAIVYINGQEVQQSMITGIDWTGCDILSIMSGAPRFTGWDHKSDNSFMDDLRLFNKALTQVEIQNIIGVTNPYEPADGETFYMPFNDDYINLIGGGTATIVGTPSFSGEAKKGSNAYAGAADSYLTFPTDGLTTEDFSASFWYNVNASPDRAGILVMGPPDTERPEYPTVQNLRTNGFRFFREGSPTNQIFKLNVGNGTADTWIDGGAAASLDPATAGWQHIAFTISGTKAIVYIDGVQVATADITGVDWTGCDILSIGSGAPRFTEWGHKSDASFIDELRLFNRALSPEEVLNIRNDN